MQSAFRLRISPAENTRGREVTRTSYWKDRCSSVLGADLLDTMVSFLTEEQSDLGLLDVAVFLQG